MNSMNDVINNVSEKILLPKTMSMKVLLLLLIVQNCVDIKLFYVDSRDDLDQGLENTIIINSLLSNTTIFVKDENKSYQMSEFISYINAKHQSKAIHHFTVQYSSNSNFTVGLFERNREINTIFLGNVFEQQVKLFNLLLNDSNFFLYETLGENTFLDFLRLSKIFGIKDDKKFESCLKELTLYYNRELKDEYFLNLMMNFQTFQQEVDNWVILKSFNILGCSLYKNFSIHSTSPSETFEGEILDKNTLFSNIGNNVNIILSPTFANTWKSFYPSFCKHALLNFLLKLVNVDIIEIKDFHENNILDFGFFMPLMPQNAVVLYINDSSTDRILDILCILSFLDTIRILKIKDKTLNTSSVSKFYKFRNLKNMIIEVETLQHSALYSILDVAKCMKIESLNIKCENVLKDLNNCSLWIPIETPCYYFSIGKYINSKNEAFRSMIVKSYGNVITSTSVEIFNSEAEDLINFLSLFPNLNELFILNRGPIKGSEDLSVKFLEEHKIKSLKLQNFVIDSRLLDKILNTSILQNLTLIECQIQIDGDLFPNPYICNNSLDTLNIFDSSFTPSLFYNNFVYKLKNLKKFDYSGKYMIFNIISQDSKLGGEIVNSDISLRFSNQEKSGLSNLDPNNLEFSLVALYFKNSSFPTFTLKDVELNLDEVLAFKSMNNIVNLTLNKIKSTESIHLVADILQNRDLSRNIKSLCLINMDLDLNDVKSLNFLSLLENLKLINIYKDDSKCYFWAIKRCHLRKLKEINIIGEISKNNVNYLKEEFPLRMLIFE
ncbi:hypothetical protein CWI37_0323p0010 [Hamiltosporidium tvaerminnensis]|uniref:Uncharacterized protein n=1 Tax=Hamiltosporidium tvaerminnensis TaxID=1176355 RepID=A0A4Q9L932_9MICR|nr:hypothetical protein CWI37_0323p0010 [Hamiltosporidium tvaerminnensis]